MQFAELFYPVEGLYTPIEALSGRLQGSWEYLVQYFYVSLPVLFVFVYLAPDLRIHQAILPEIRYFLPIVFLCEQPEIKTIPIFTDLLLNSIAEITYLGHDLGEFGHNDDLPIPNFVMIYQQFSSLQSSIQW